jgi:hypothetical protein
MTAQTEKWLYGLGSATIGGGSAAIVSGVTSMGFDPAKFNLTNMSGVLHLLGLMAVNFIFSGILSAFFYLKQSPLPPESITETVETKLVATDSAGVVTTGSSKTVTTTPVQPLPDVSHEPPTI